MDRQIVYQLNGEWLYPEDVDRITDGLKLLKNRYHEIEIDLYTSGMYSCRNHIRNIVNDINSLIVMFGGCSDDNTLSDITIQK